MLSAHKWALSDGYVITTIRKHPKGKKHHRMYMHRMLIPQGRTTHLDGDKLNNTRANLKLLISARGTPKRNFTPSSIYKGVRKSGDRWAATVSHKKSTYSCGTYGTEIEAARAYDKHARLIKGPDAYINGV